MTHTVANSARSYLTTLADHASRLDSAVIDRYADLIYDAWRNKRRVFVFGNGGSALTASHHVCDYVKTAEVATQRRLQAFSLVDNPGLTTAIGNDIDYDSTFVYPLESYAEAGDVAVAISASGNSPNVVKACQWAKAHEMTVVAMTGFNGGKIGTMADLHINAPSDNYGIIEDLHMSIGHIAAQLLQQRVAAAALAAQSA